MQNRVVSPTFAHTPTTWGNFSSGASTRFRIKTKKSVVKKKGKTMIDKIIVLLFVATLFVVALNLFKL